MSTRPCSGLIELGINHEQQHQELFLTDLLATFAANPVEPDYADAPPAACLAIEPVCYMQQSQCADICITSNSAIPASASSDFTLIRMKSTELPFS